MTEKEIIQGCVKHKKAAQKLLYDKYGPKLMGVCFRYTNNREDAEEVFHDSMMKVYDKISSFNQNSSLTTWIIRVGVNTALDFLRKKKHALMVEYLSDKVLEIKDHDLEEEITLETCVALRALQSLPLNQQIIINLYLIDGFSHKEIAIKLNISEEASRAQYSRAKKKLAELVKNKLKQHEQKG